MAFNNPSIFSFSSYGQPSFDSMTRRTQTELYNITKAREVIEKSKKLRESENWYPWFRYFGPDMGLVLEKHFHTVNRTQMVNQMMIYYQMSETFKKYQKIKSRI